MKLWLFLAGLLTAGWILLRATWRERVNNLIQQAEAYTYEASL